jgi:UDP-N-acetylmuramoylalanine--D-glutamate ligase
MPVAVVGAGVTGRASAEALLRVGARPWVVDTRQAEDVPDAVSDAAEDVGCPIYYGDSSRLADAELVVLSPGVGPDDPFLDVAYGAGIEVIGEIELAVRLRPAARIVGITATNGKSTTTALTGALLQAGGFAASVCGNIGVPLETEVLDRPPETVFVTELSSFQLETVTTLHPEAAALLNISDDHRDRHPTIESYIAAKARIFQNHRLSDTAVVNADCDLLAQLRHILKARCAVLEFSVTRQVTRGAFVEDDELILRMPGAADAVVTTEEEFSLRGLHNVDNALAAACLAGALGVQAEAMRPVFRTFRAAAHTFRTLGWADGVLYVNDSKGTNVDATLWALASCTGPVVLIAGGSRKDADYTPLGQAIADSCRALLLIGDTAPEIMNAAMDAGLTEIMVCKSLEEAVTGARAVAERGDTVLLSPACASFGLFRSYAHRGEVFEELVAAIPRFQPIEEVER